MSQSTPHLYEFGPFRLDPRQRRLLRDGTHVQLTPRAFDVLALLVERRDSVVGKDEMMQALWPDSFVEEANLTQHVSTVRKALGESAHDRHYIVTVPGRGYRFAAEVRVVADGFEEEAAEGGAEGGGARAGREGEPAARSIAVLPFALIGDQSGDDYLGLGLADALITRLSNVRRILTRPTSAIRKFKGRGRDAVRAGRELDVDTVLDGSIQRVGERLRVTVQLVGVREEAPLWAEKFDARFTDIFDVEDTISERVVKALTVRLSGEERSLLTRHQTDNPEAYRFYLMGIYYHNKRTPDSVRRAAAHFEQAIRFDERFAPAYVGLAQSVISLNSFSLLPTGEAHPRAKAAIERALALDRRNAEGYAVRGVIRARYEFDWEGAERDYRRAVALNPRHAGVHRLYGTYLGLRGRFEEAGAELRIALRLDPLSITVRLEMAKLSYFMRRHDRAEQTCREMIEMDARFGAAHGLLMMVLAAQGRFREAVVSCRKAMRLSDNDPEAVALLSYLYHESGQSARAERLREGLLRLAETRYVSPTNMALMYAANGERDLAFEWLERAFEERAFVLSYISVWPHFDPLRSDPRFADLLRRMGLATGRE